MAQDHLNSENGMKNSKVEISWLLALFAERCEIQISNLPSGFVAREIAKLKWIHANFMPFSCRNRTNFTAFPFSLLFYMKDFCCTEFRACEQISKVKPICILSHVFDIIPYDVTCWLLEPADLLLKKAVPLFV